MDIDAVEIPFGAVALNWIRMYLPLLRAGLPQSGDNVGLERLGFVGPGFRALLQTGVAAQDLRIGMRIKMTEGRADALRLALTESRHTIEKNPMNYTTHASSDERIFKVGAGQSRTKGKGAVSLDAETLREYGTVVVPGEIWRTLQRLGAWVEPVLVSEWSRLVRDYANRMKRSVSIGVVEHALIWLEPKRDTLVARSAVTRLQNADKDVRCVWSGTKLRRGEQRYEIDHCLPWSAWPCSDLWNLMPATRAANNNKRDALPSFATMISAKDAIVEWWETGWFEDASLRDRFEKEVSASLPIGSGSVTDREDVFAGLEIRRLRLLQDQQLREWPGHLRV